MVDERLMERRRLQKEVKEIKKVKKLQRAAMEVT
jgi:hypothetical protein